MTDISCKCKKVFYNLPVMDVSLEEFSFRHICSQLREFNTVTKNNRAQIGPHFWWANANDLTRFRFIMSSLLAEKLSHRLSDFPYHKRFIIRHNGEFAGVIGLDFMSVDAPRSEVWIFVDSKHMGQHVASTAVKKVEDFARQKSIHSIRACIANTNQRSKNLFCANNYEPSYTDSSRFYNQNTMVWWYKALPTKVIEK